MKAFIVFLAAFVAAAVAGPDEDIWLQFNRRMPEAYYSLKEPIKRQPVTGRIVGGVDAEIENYPYQLSLRQGGSHICGASVISDHWALSAAHCTHPVPTLSSMTLRGGSANRSEGGVIFQVAEIVNHPQYNPRNIENDVSVLRTTLPLVGLHIRPVHLVPADTYYPGGTRAVLSGWGLTSVPGSLPVILQRVDIPVISDAACRAGWPAGWITDDMLCASEAGRDACNGDSGGPLVVGGRQVGIVSWGSTNCLGNDPGVYARVAHPRLRSFIATTTGV